MGAVTVIFDTNVVISAMGFGGIPEECIIRAFDDDVEVAVSDAILDELRTVMQYEHLPFEEDEIDELLWVYRGYTGAEVVTPTEDVNVIDDPDDNKFLECAIAADADYLVSGDEEDVQPVGSYRGVEIVSPAEFLERLE